MSETTPSVAPAPPATSPSAAEVRIAAEALKSAIDRLLAAVEARVHELDPAVLEAFDALAAAAEEYDELLYSVHDEVTPFEVPSEQPAGYAGPEEVEAFSVFVRRDYVITDPEALLTAARSAGEGFDAENADSRAAVAELFDAFDVDEIAYRAEEVGLEAAESTLWVIASDPDGLGGWHEDPFSEADAERLLYRVDVVDEDEIDDEDFEDDPDEEDEDVDEEEDEDDSSAL